MYHLNSSFNLINIFFVLFLLYCSILFANGTEAKLRSPASDFNKFRIVQLAVQHGRTKRAITSTRDTSGAHHPEVIIKVPIDDREFVLNLQLNEDLIPDNHVVRYQKGGKAVTHKPKKEDIDLCQYSGSVGGMPGSWVAVSTCEGVRGVIFDGEQLRYIEPAQGEEIQSQHFVYDHSELNSDHPSGGLATYTGYGPLEMRRNKYLISKPFNKPRYVELVLVADHSEYLNSNKSMQRVHRKLKDLTNIVNSVYAPLNIFVVLVGVDVWTQKDKTKISADISYTLNNFLQYRNRELGLHNDNAHLLTSTTFINGTVGLAYLKTMCSLGSVGITADHSEVIGLVAMTLAHEIGHNFNMDHDEGNCLHENYIMNPHTSHIEPTKWSTCSLKALAQFLEEGRCNCLYNKPKKALTMIPDAYQWVR